MKCAKTMFSGSDTSDSCLALLLFVYTIVQELEEWYLEPKHIVNIIEKKRKKRGKTRSTAEESAPTKPWYEHLWWHKWMEITEPEDELRQVLQRYWNNLPANDLCAPTVGFKLRVVLLNIDLCCIFSQVFSLPHFLRKHHPFFGPHTFAEDLMCSKYRKTMKADRFLIWDTTDKPTVHPSTSGQNWPEQATTNF